MKNSYTPSPLTEIYPTDIKNKTTLLTLLYQNRNGINIGELIEISGLHRKTIYKYLKEINELCLEHFNEKFINISEKKQYFFTETKIEFLTLRLLLIERAPITQLTLAFLHSSAVSIPLFCSRNFITESTLKVYLKTYNKFLRPYGIFLSTKSEILNIVGDEAKIRYFMASFLWRTYRGIKWPFITLSRNKLKSSLSMLHSNSGGEVNQSKLEVLLYLLATNILRVKTQNLITKSSLPSYSKALCKDFLHDFQKSLATDYYLPPEEIEYAVLNLHTFPEYFIDNHTPSKILEILHDNAKSSYLSIVHFLKFVKERHKDWRIDSFSGQTFLSVLISSRLFVDIFKDIHFNIYDLRLIYHSQREFPTLLPGLETFIRKDNNALAETILKALVFRYAQAYITIFPPQDFEPPIDILVVTDMPVYIEALLINRLKATLSEKFNFTIHTSLSIVEPDLIVSTGKVDESLTKHEIIYVYPDLPHNDTQSVLRSCKSIVQKKYNFSS